MTRKTTLDIPQGLLEPDEGVAARRDAAITRALNTPPKPFTKKPAAKLASAKKQPPSDGRS